MYIYLSDQLGSGETTHLQKLTNAFFGPLNSHISSYWAAAYDYDESFWEKKYLWDKNHSYDKFASRTDTNDGSFDNDDFC